MNPSVVEHFAKFAKMCFTRFGDRVKYWITINEPWTASVLGHDSGGQHAPGRTVDPSREVYKVGGWVGWVEDWPGKVYYTVAGMRRCWVLRMEECACSKGGKQENCMGVRMGFMAGG